MEVRNSHSAVVTHPTVVSQMLTSVKAFDLTGKFVLQQSIGRKPTTCKTKLLNLCHRSETLTSIPPPAVLCNLQIAFVLLSGGIFGVQLSLTERDVCLPRSNRVIPQITSSHLNVPPSLCRWKTRQRTRPRSRGSGFSLYGSRCISLL